MLPKNHDLLSVAVILKKGHKIQAKISNNILVNPRLNTYQEID
jgi:hypothetical protein